MTYSLLNLVFAVALGSMKRLTNIFNLILATGFVGAGLLGCKSPLSSAGSQHEMAIFGEAATAGVHLTIQIEVPRASGKAKWIDADPLFWVADRILGATLVKDQQGFEVLRLVLTSAGAREFESITSRYQQRNLFFMYPMPDPVQPGKTKPCCVGTYRVNGIVASRVLDVIPDASHSELEMIIKDLNKKAGVK